MVVPVVRVRIVGMRMGRGLVHVGVDMRLVRFCSFGMLMLVMPIVDVAVLMLEPSMIVVVRVALREMQPDSHRHQQAGDQQLPAHRVTE